MYQQQSSALLAFAEYCWGMSDRVQPVEYTTIQQQSFGTFDFASNVILAASAPEVVQSVVATSTQQQSALTSFAAFIFFPYSMVAESVEHPVVAKIIQQQSSFFGEFIVIYYEISLLIRLFGFAFAA
jgi:hypothetical protein